MCGRYLFFNGNSSRLQDLISAAEERLPADAFSEISLFEVFPGTKAFAGVMNPETGNTVMKIMHWGFPGKGKRQIINARSETVFSSDFFRGCIPCAVPATAYYEWSPDKIKYEFTVDDEVFYLGAVCRRINGIFRFVILTEPASGIQAQIHDRQPVIFSYEDAKTWCASAQPTSLLNNSIQNRYLSRA